jgi:hypothetical protein
MNDTRCRSNSTCPRFGRFLGTSLFMARIRAPIPKHDCAIVGVPLGFRYGHSKEHETRDDCR